MTPDNEKPQPEPAATPKEPALPALVPDDEPPWLPPPATPVVLPREFPVWLRIIVALALFALAYVGVPFDAILGRAALVLIGLRVLGVPTKVLVILVVALILLVVAFVVFLAATCKWSH